MTETRRAAFFDVDKTLIPGSSLFLLVRGAYERDFFRVRDILKFGWQQMRFRISGREAESAIETSRDSSLSFVKGHDRDEIRSWGRQIAEERILPRVYEDVAALITSHRSAGDETYLVTATPVELASFLAEALSMTGALGTESEVDENGKYTGRLVGDVLHGPAKAKAVAELAASRGLDLNSSSAYSDSANDLPLLESVGHPHAVNPEPELRKVARSRGWPIHELRTKRKALLIGVPSALGGGALFGLGLAVGALVWRRPPKRTWFRLTR